MEIEVTDVAIVENDSIVISTELGTEVVTAESTATELIPDAYVLTSLGIFTGNLDGSIPIWLLDAIDTALTTGDGNITSVLADMQSLIDDLEIGVSQNITQIENTNVSLSSLETSVVSRLDDNDASIVDLATTRVTESEAQTIALSVQQSTFGSDVEAFIGNIASTYVDGSSAIAQDIDTLVASVNGVSASVTQMSIVSVDEDEARAKHSLVVDVDGSIAGYVAETDGTTSEFIISADVFKVGNLTTNYAPLVINVPESRVEFNGYVSFSGIGLDSGSTTIDGGYIEALSVQADKLKASDSGVTTWTGGGLISANFNGNAYGSIGTPTAGFRLSSNAAGTETDPTIYGAYIKGGSISSDTLLTYNNVQVRSDNPLNFGKITHSLSDSGYFYGYDYSSGFLATRICNTTGQITITGSCNGYFTGLNSRSVTMYLEYSISGGTWTVIDSQYSHYWSAIEDTVVPVSATLIGVLATSIVAGSQNITFRVRYSGSGYSHRTSGWLATVLNS